MIENSEPKIVSTFIITVNELGGMSFKDASPDDQVHLTPADMADYVISFGKTLEKYHEEEKLRSVIQEESSKIIAQYIRAQKELFQTIEQEKSGGAQADEKKAPDVLI